MHRSRSETTTKSHDDQELEDWLGGRDSNSEQGLFLTW